MFDVRKLSRRCARLALFFAALLHTAGLPLLTHETGGSWTEGSAIHAPGKCPDGGPAHNERACRTFQTPTPELAAGRAVRLADVANLVRFSPLTAWHPAGPLHRSALQARAPPVA